MFSVYKGRVYPLPINLGTICEYFGAAMSPDEARALIAEQAAEVAAGRAANLEEKAVSLIGRPLYEAFIRGYTAKQWQTDPVDLPAGDHHPAAGALHVQQPLLQRHLRGAPGRRLHRLAGAHGRPPEHRGAAEHRFRAVRSDLAGQVPVCTPGRWTSTSQYAAGELGWRTLDFELEVLGTGDFQGTPVMNYADEDVPFTRIHEFRHFHPERDWYPKDKTVIMREFSRFASRGDEPYYPINTAQDRERLLGYREMADREPGVLFGGRLGTYKYLDMHMAIGSALSMFDNRIRPHFAVGAPLHRAGEWPDD